MKIKAEQLTKHYQNQAQAIYIIHGEEPLLTQECCDSLRALSKEQGFTERDIIHVGPQFNGDELYASNQDASLFGDRKVIELRMPNGKPGTKGAKAIIDYCENPNPDNLLIISCGKLDASSQRSKWFSAVETAGASIQIWPITGRDLPRWIEQRIASKGLSIAADALELLSERVEGNLYAAAQEIDKLPLYAEGQKIDIDTVLATVSDSSRHNIFGLIDTVHQGNSRLALKMLRNLRAEGNQVFTLLPLITRELKILHHCAGELEKGININAVLKSQRVWDSRKALVSASLKKLSKKSISKLLQLANTIDQCSKGMATGNNWDLFEQLIMSMSGHPTPTKHR